jgi:hypothetical protein
MVEMEPEWTKNISSNAVCNFFYFFFVLYSVIAVFVVFTIISLFFMDLPKNILITTSIQNLLILGISITTALFHYLVCARALLPSTGGMRA